MRHSDIARALAPAAGSSQGPDRAGKLRGILKKLEGELSKLSSALPLSEQTKFGPAFELLMDANDELTSLAPRDDRR